MERNTENTKPAYYFAYGSNMDMEQMRRRCPDAKCIDTAVLHGWKFALDEVGYATVVLEAGASVPGLLWMLTDADEAELDTYEGVRYNCYEKVTLSVVPKRAYEPTQALVYVSLRGANEGARVQGYLERIVHAAAHAGFGRSYLGMLKDLWVGRANADERTTHPVLEDGKTLDELVPKNDALGQHLIQTLRARGATDQEIWQFMLDN